MANDPKSPEQKNEGEGSKSADRKYREDVERFVESHDVERLAREAQRDVENDEAGYRKAEEQGKLRIAEEDEKDKDLI